MVEDEGDLVRLQHEVDRHHDGAEAHQGVAQRDEAVGIARQHGDPVAPPDSAARESRRQPLARGVEGAIAPARRPAGEAEPAGNALRAAAQRVGERLTTERGVHESSLTADRRLGAARSGESKAPQRRGKRGGLQSLPARPSVRQAAGARARARKARAACSPSIDSEWPSPLKDARLDRKPRLFQDSRGARRLGRRDHVVALAVEEQHGRGARRARPRRPDQPSGGGHDRADRPAAVGERVERQDRALREAEEGDAVEPAGKARPLDLVRHDPVEIGARAPATRAGRLASVTPRTENHCRPLPPPSKRLGASGATKRAPGATPASASASGVILAPSAPTPCRRMIRQSDPDVMAPRVRVAPRRARSGAGARGPALGSRITAPKQDFRKVGAGFRIKVLPNQKRSKQDLVGLPTRSCLVVADVRPHLAAEHPVRPGGVDEDTGSSSSVPTSRKAWVDSDEAACQSVNWYGTIIGNRLIAMPT